MPEFIPEKIQVVKRAPPPPELPALGRGDPAEVSFIGRTNYVTALEEKRFVFGLKRRDRRRHVYLVGKSGMGKSRLLELLIRQDVAQGYGVCLLDPDGDLIEQVLDFIPPARVDDVVLIDPSDTERPVAWNPLAGVSPHFRHQLTKGFIEILEAQFGAGWDPRMEHLFRFVMLTLLEIPQATLEEAISLLTDPSFRAAAAERVQDPMVKRFWQKEFEQWSRSEKTEAEVVSPLVNKLEQFFTDPMLRSVLCEKENKVDLFRLIQERKIILVNLCRGKLGKENASFLGGAVIVKLKEAGMARLDVPENERRDFYIYLEEFHHLVTETLEHLMLEARKYHFAMTLSHQYLGQIIPHFRGSIFANVGTIIVFRVGGEDAERLESEMAPVFRVKDMINLGAREFYIKMVIDGEAHDPFSAETLKTMPAPHRSVKNEAIEASRKRYGISVRQQDPLELQKVTDGGGEHREVREHAEGDA